MIVQVVESRGHLEGELPQDALREVTLLALVPLVQFVQVPALRVLHTEGNGQGRGDTSSHREREYGGDKCVLQRRARERTGT